MPSGAKLNANNYELMLSLAGDAYTVEQLAGNSFAKNMYMDRIRLYLPTIFVNSIDDYDNGYSKSLALEQSQVKGIGFILIGVETALFLLIIIAFIKL